MRERNSHCATANVLNNGYFPNLWKVAKIKMLPKKNKNPRIISNYRPISLLPNMRKLFEIVINIAITKFVNLNQVVPNEQFGFRKKHSTVHAVTRIVFDANQALVTKKFTEACLIDLEKTFDSVWIEGLIGKLLKKISYTFG